MPSAPAKGRRAMRLAFAIVLAALALRAIPAHAQNSSDECGYAFYRVKDHFLRLDTRTGAVAQCEWAANGWTCRAVPDDRAAFDSEIARLQSENAALKRALLAHGLELPHGLRAAPPLAADGGKAPSEAELERMLAFLQKAWRRLVEMIQDLPRKN